MARQNTQTQNNYNQNTQDWNDYSKLIINNTQREKFHDATNYER